MSKKKSKKKGRKKTQEQSRKTGFFKGLLLITLVSTLIVGMGVLARWVTNRWSTEPVRMADKSSQTHKPLVFEVFPDEKHPAHKDRLPPPPVGKDLPPIKRTVGHGPRAAIIIDDVGYDPYIAKGFIKLNKNITLSVLPYSPYKDSIIRSARKKDMEILLHLPMEPLEYPRINAGPGALLLSMSAETLLQQLAKDLDQVPIAVGVNNHMGSRMTADSRFMFPILTVLKKRGLFFVDSRTTPRTVCGPAAKSLQLPFGSRDVFLDHVQDADFIRRQLKVLVQTAKTKGVAIGIGHPHKVTLVVLREELAKVCSQLRLVRVSDLIEVSS